MQLRGLLRLSTKLSTVLLLVGSTIFTSCKKDDITPPVVTIIGGNITISLQGTFVDQGATVNDNKDGVLSPSVSGNVDVNHTGVYQLTYTATDVAGNSGTAVRNVTVVNDLDAMTGIYSCTVTTTGSSPFTYTQAITASSTVNRRIGFGKFSDYSNNTSIYADIDNTGATSPITLPSQTGIQVGSPPADRTFAGTGARTSSTTFGLTYTETTGGSTANTTEVFVKQ